MKTTPTRRAILTAAAGALLLPFLAQAQDDPDLKLLAYWDFEEEDPIGVGGEDETIDSEVDGGEFVSEGRYGSGMNFDQGPATLHVADASFLNEASERDEVTYIFWQQNTSAVRNQSAFWAVSPESNDGQRGSQAHTPWGNNNIYFDTAGCCGGGTQRINKAWDGDWDNWNHFAFVKDGEDKRIYVNGDLFHQGINTSPLPTDITELWVGSQAEGSNSVPGTLDEFGVFAGVLSADEIKRFFEEDGLLVSDIVEFIDEDGDLMHDSWEARHGLDPAVDDSALDPDGDTLTNIQGN